MTFSVLKNGQSFKAQQAMLMLKSKSQGLAAYAVGKHKGGSYVAVIGAASVEKQIGKLVRCCTWWAHGLCGGQEALRFHSCSNMLLPVGPRAADVAPVLADYSEATLGTRIE